MFEAISVAVLELDELLLGSCSGGTDGDIKEFTEACVGVELLLLAPRIEALGARL